MRLQTVGGRLEVLQRLVAELELEQKRLQKKNSNLEKQKDRLKKDRDVLRDILRQVLMHTKKHFLNGKK